MNAVKRPGSLCPFRRGDDLFPGIPVTVMSPRRQVEGLPGEGRSREKRLDHLHSRPPLPPGRPPGSGPIPAVDRSSVRHASPDRPRTGASGRNPCCIGVVGHHQEVERTRQLDLQGRWTRSSPRPGRSGRHRPGQGDFRRPRRPPRGPCGGGCRPRRPESGRRGRHRASSSSCRTLLPRPAPGRPGSGPTRRGREQDEITARRSKAVMGRAPVAVDRGG